MMNWIRLSVAILHMSLMQSLMHLRCSVKHIGHSHYPRINHIADKIIVYPVRLQRVCLNKL